MAAAKKTTIPLKRQAEELLSDSENRNSEMLRR